MSDDMIPRKEADEMMRMVFGNGRLEFWKAVYLESYRKSGSSSDATFDANLALSELDTKFKRL